MKTSDFDYELPESFIAQSPASPRDSSKMFVFNSSNSLVSHKKFFNILDYLTPNDVLVVNQSKVIPARVEFFCEGRNREIFILKNISGFSYRAMVFPGRFFQKGRSFRVNESLSGVVLDVLDDGTRIIDFDGDVLFFGRVPLPPYIKNRDVEFSDYQTVYANNQGSVAAPTAGLHFTNDLLNKIEERGVEVVKLTLHVGQGTFLPVKSDNITDHKMHSEYYEISEEAALRLNSARSKGKRIIAVGTTSVRVLETCLLNRDDFVSCFGETDIFIYPEKHNWKAVDALITNFHLPKSTLIMLVASFLENKGVSDPVEKIKEFYSIAKNENYRFYSFGDAMFLF
jgi:S-adenosylmethionine:tRNA ribosyltransferase-isomerase